MDLRQTILAATDRQRVKVHVPEWGVDVWLQPMSVGDRDSWENEWLAKGQQGGVKNWRAKFLAKCLLDESGNRVFNDSQVDELASKSSDVVCRLFDQARKVNALTAEEIDEIAKN